MTQEDSAERILYLIKSKGPQSAKELSGHLDMTTMGARQHLAKLEESGLIFGREEKKLRGRPVAKWHLSETGHQRFPDSHANLTVDLIASTKAVFGEEGLDQLIDKRSRDQLDSYLQELEPFEDLKERLQRLAEIRTREGYMAEAVEKEGQIYLVENHCPICVAAQECQALCRSELDNFKSCFAGMAEIERSEHILEGARRCCYLLKAI